MTMRPATRLVCSDAASHAPLWMARSPAAQRDWTKLRPCTQRRNLRLRPTSSAAGAGLVLAFDAVSLFSFEGNLMPGNVATIFSATIALGSVIFNLYGNLLTERKRATLQQEFMREKLAIEGQSELRSIVARYRGPLLEAAVDLEQRLYHLATMTDEWGPWSVVSEEELVYTAFTVAQFLGFVEVVRREGPRESSFLQQGNPQGTDTLNSLVEGFRFAMAAHTDCLQTWCEEEGSEGVRDNPGSRRRASPTRQRPTTANHSDNGTTMPGSADPVTPRRVVTPDGLTKPWIPSPSSSCIAISSGIMGSQDEEGFWGVRPPSEAFRLSRGQQRAIGSMMVITPCGASRHYTMSYGDFYARLRSDPYFVGWFKPLYEDMLALVASGIKWDGRPAFPANRWTRLLLLQQLLIDCVDLLDPACVRVPENRRVRLAPVRYNPLPNFQGYRDKLENMDSGYSVAAQGAANGQQPAQDGLGSLFHRPLFSESSPATNVGPNISGYSSKDSNGNNSGNNSSNGSNSASSAIGNGISGQARIVPSSPNSAPSSPNSAPSSPNSAPSSSNSAPSSSNSAPSSSNSAPSSSNSVPKFSNNNVVQQASSSAILPGGAQAEGVQQAGGAQAGRNLARGVQAGGQPQLQSLEGVQGQGDEPQPPQSSGLKQQQVITPAQGPLSLDLFSQPQGQRQPDTGPLPSAAWSKLGFGSAPVRHVNVWGPRPVGSETSNPREARGAQASRRSARRVVRSPRNMRNTQALYTPCPSTAGTASQGIDAELARPLAENSSDSIPPLCANSQAAVNCLEQLIEVNWGVKSK